MRVVRAVVCAAMICMVAPAAAAAAAEVRLAVDREAVPSGGTQRIRIENDGSAVVSYGRPYELARWSRGEGRWVPVPVHRLFSSDLLSAGAGSAGPWEPVAIGAHAARGRYRVRKRVQVGFGAPMRIVAATFAVVPR